MPGEIDTIKQGNGVPSQSAYLSSFPDRTISSILILIAMEAEALPIVHGLGLTRDDPPVLPAPIRSATWRGTVSGASVAVVQSGKCSRHGVDLVGTVPAAVAAYAAVSAFQPDVVISAGTAGGFKARGASIGDVYLSTKTVNHDRRIPIPGFDAYGVGEIPSLPVPELLAARGAGAVANDADAPVAFKTGVVSSGNSLDATETDLSHLSTHEAAVKEMEAAAVAWTADLFGTPFLGVKAITDIVDGGRPTNEEFLENLAAAGRSLQKAVPVVVSFLAGKKLSQL